MKILILGAKGMLGQALVKKFGDVGDEVVGYDKEDLDVTDVERVGLALDEIKPEVVLNAVALNAVDKIEESIEIFELAKQVNGDAVGNLAKLCRERGIIFVHYSSDYVFAGTDEHGYHEDADRQPINKYGETKALGEQLVQEHGDKYYIIRLSKLFGKPAISIGSKKSFVDTMLYLVTEGGKTSLDVVDEEVSAPTYAPDLAHVTFELLKDKYPFGIYHGANSGACTWYEWAKEVFAYKGISVKVNPVSSSAFPRLAQRPRFSKLINTKLPAQRTWQEALGEYLQN